MNVVPVADENFYVYSCSSDKIALLNFFSPYLDKPNLVEPDLADGANLIYFPPNLTLGLPLLLSGELYNDSLCFLYSSSIAFCTSLFYYGAS